MDPYITINKLAEYTKANATRRRQIIRSLKEDSDFRKVYYSSVKLILPKFVKNEYSDEIIDQAITDTTSKSAISDWEIKDKRNSILALKTLKETELPTLKNYKVITGSPKIEKIILGGLKVTIKPEVYLENTKTGKIGAIKFHLAKTIPNRLKDESLEYAATLIKHSLVEHGHDIKNIDTKSCLCIDVFNGLYKPSPSAYKRTLDLLECSCEEIVARWDSV
jgi:hypothetical protein